MHARHPGSVATGVRPHAQSGGWGDVGPGWPSFSEPVSPRLGGSTQVNNPTSLSNPGRRSARTISISPPAPRAWRGSSSWKSSMTTTLHWPILPGTDALLRLVSWSRKHRRAPRFKRTTNTLEKNLPALWAILSSKLLLPLDIEVWGINLSARGPSVASKSHPSIFGSSRVASWATE
jgi:hypothetical protein